jgi:NAD(P)-dependent dehydrogenase (short-subunit alcohol dehydrogenase family)
MGQRLKGKNAVVTGSSHGIGKAIALALAAEGASVVVNSSGSSPEGPGTDLKPLNDVVDEIKAKGEVAIASCGSVADFAYAGRLIKACVDNFGSIDILVNCAGIGEVGSIIDVPLEVWQHVVDVHLNGTFNCCKHACPLMAQQRSGRIMNVGSHAFLGTYGGTGYAAAKGGIISLTRAIAKDMGEYGVTCNAFCPGARTRLSSGQWYEEYIRALHARRLLTEVQKNAALNPPDPDLVPPLILYLATDEAANITGQVFTVAGGHVGLFPEPKEVTLIYKNYKKYGPWTIDEIARLLPSKLSVHLVNPSPAKPSDGKVT